MKAGQVLGGRYELADWLGKGGMAVVWSARDRVLGRTVAVKVLAAHHLADPQSRERIRQEARAAAALSHPNIAQVHDYGEAELDGTATPYVVMEFVRGDTLQERISDGPVAPAFAMRMCAEVGAALAAAHADGLVHRDIKPANVMVTATGAKVVDFGIAAPVDYEEGDDELPELYGTPAYLAPERLIDVTVEPASDVYALGMLLYRLLAGRSPWDSETTTQMLRAHIYVEPEPLPPLPEVPEHIAALCHRCLSKDPTERPSAREVAALLARAADDRAAAASAADFAAPVPAATEPGPRRRWARVLPVAVALCALVAVAGWLLWPTGPDRSASALPGAVGSAVPTPAPATAPAAPTTSAPTARKPRPTRTGQILPAGPTGATTTPAAPATTATPGPTPTSAAPATRTFSSAGGTVRATCSSPDTAELLSWTPVEPYQVKKVVPGPAALTSVTFKHGGDRVVVEIVCQAGGPVRV